MSGFSIARASIDKALITWMLMLGCLLGGIWGFYDLGRLEDPAFSIKTAVVITNYPGASADEVARRVSEPLESAIQQMSELDIISSRNVAGRSEITVDIRDSFGPDALPQIWDRLSKRVADARGQLPAGAGEPYVNDSFGDVFGLFYAVSAPGFSDSELHQLSTFLRREMQAVDGVSNVEIAGLPDEVIVVTPVTARMFNLGLPVDQLAEAISAASNQVDSGAIIQDGRDIRIISPTALDTTEEFERLSIVVDGGVMLLQDLAEVTRERAPHQPRLIRHQGAEAFTLAIAARDDLNVVEVGGRADARLEELNAFLPYGVTISPIYQQHHVVAEASDAFLINLAMSVAIVILVLALFMGWRAALVVGTTLLLTVVGTLFVMAIFTIEMQRISLGALIIAMGMLVDNAIVVAEGMQGDMARGKSSREAAAETAGKTQIPLLGATVIGIMAFSGIGLSSDATGEFLFSLFAVIGISLLLSWLLAVTATPLLGHYLFRRGDGNPTAPYSGAVFRGYAAMLGLALRFRWTVVVLLLGVTVACYVGFTRLEQQFFPNSNTPIFFAHYKLPEGTRLESTADDMALLEERLSTMENVLSVTSFIGSGASRFMLTYAAEDMSPTYGHLIIRAPNLDVIPALRAEIEAFAREALPDGDFRTEQLAFGPGGGSPIQARFSGPDPVVLRQLGAEAIARLEAASDELINVRHDWYEQEMVLRPLYASDRAQVAGISREAVSNSLLMATDGRQVGMFQEDERQIPILLRSEATGEPGRASLLDQFAYSTTARMHLPLAQVIDGFETEIRDSTVARRDRVLTLTVMAGVREGTSVASAFAQVRGVVEAMPLPSGYSLAWGGEHENSQNAQASLAVTLPVSVLIMVLISVLLFGRLRQPLIIWLLVPMSVNGVAIALLASGVPFSFTALLGLLSLSGMLIKNGIVLVEEIDLTRADGRPLREAIIEASTSRVRPVVLAAATTILGMLPLLWDAFFISMAVTIMGGLGFATLLTLIAAPVLYFLLFRRDEPAAGAAAPAGSAAIPAA